MKTDPVGANYETKPRMRICFDPEHEIPKLQAWFSENNHPSRLQVEEYVSILNSLESRKGKKPLDINNVIYWFKNTRAAVKRAQAESRSSPARMAASNGCNEWSSPMGRTQPMHTVNGNGLGLHCTWTMASLGAALSCMKRVCGT